METGIITKTYLAPPINLPEIRRYSGVGKTDSGCDDIINTCIAEADGIFTYKVCYRVLPLKITGKTVDFGYFQAESADLAKCLDGSGHAVIFALTVGMGIDRLIRKYSLISPAKSVIFQGIGAERAESLCDVFNDEINREFTNITKRFSPGYGDFSLENQRNIFRLLEAERSIGTALGENLLISPSKSITGVIGIK